MSYNDDKNPHLPIGDDFLCGALQSEAWKEGYLAAAKEFGWHQNCAETPVPRDRPVLARRSSGEYVAVEFERTHDGKFQFRIGCSNGYIDEKSITHWRRFSVVDE